MTKPFAAVAGYSKPTNIYNFYFTHSWRLTNSSDRIIYTQVRRMPVGGGRLGEKFLALVKSNYLLFLLSFAICFDILF